MKETWIGYDITKNSGRGSGVRVETNYVKPHSSVYTLVDMFRKEQKKSEENIVKLETGIRYKRKPKYILLDERINEKTIKFFSSLIGKIKKKILFAFTLFCSINLAFLNIAILSDPPTKHSKPKNFY
ncbi:hypothetical protein BpHYR1_007571 [Brachionus plicatilis]|uniref:Uncharacterized protein n=1 Tax=Brachionus plicatilis TaxID=10195 RepID=A0A3M7TAN0_BRAPC|nr:hypothetical protein BpHYR1_007571 [Brachionus plicatilis]